MGTYGYAGLVNLGSIPITVGSKTASHPVMLSEETNFDCVLGRSWAIARERVDGQQSESRRMRKWASICRWSAVTSHSASLTVFGIRPCLSANGLET
jgi:hypothetical protein